MRKQLFGLLILWGWSLWPAYSQRAAAPEPVSAAQAEQWNRQQQAGFTENKGQLADQDGRPNQSVRYLLSMPGLKVQLREGSFSYDTYTLEKTGSKDKEVAGAYKYHRVDITLEGADPSARLVAEHPREEVANVINQRGEFYDIRSFSKVTYREIYPGIDLEFVARQGADKPVEYNFIVRPGADPSQIRLRYKGQRDIALAAGRIRMELSHGALTENIPASWLQQDGGPVEVRYEAVEKDLYGFQVPAYDRGKTLVIDPTPNLEWSTYYGGSGYDIILAVETDPAGNIYVTGTTNSPNNIATAGTHDGTLGGEIDIMIAKFSKTGQRLWGTYYGGNSWDYAFGITFHSGQLYIAGSSASTGMATAGAHQVQGGSTAAPFIQEPLLARFNAGNGKRNWATYYGGGAYTGETHPTGKKHGFFNKVKIAPDGSIYAIGGSRGQYNPDATGVSGQVATVGTFRRTGGASTSFLVKFNTSLARVWGTYLAGPVRGAATQGSQDLAIDAAGNVYVAGGVGGEANTDVNFAAGVGEGTARGNGYLGKIRGSNGTRIWGRYFNGAINALELDAANNRLIAVGNAPGSIFGGTGATGIASPGAWQNTLAADHDGFWATFDLTGHYQSGTYLGTIGLSSGPPQDNFTMTFATSAKLDAEGNLVIFGTTNTTGGELASDCSHQPTPGGGNDVFINRFSLSSGQRLWGTYVGGSGHEYASATVGAGDSEPGDRCLAITPTGEIVVGFAASTTGNRLSTPGAHQRTHGGGSYDGVIAKFGSGVLPTGFAVAASTLAPMTQTACILGMPAVITGNAVGVTFPVNYTRKLFYQWQKAEDPSGPWEDMPGEVFKDLQPVPANTTLYYRRVVKANVDFCNQETVDVSEVASVEVNTNVAPVANADGPQWYVCGPGANTVTLNGGAAGGTGPYTYQWYEGSSSYGTLVGSAANLTTPGLTEATTYTLKITDAAGCSDIDQVTVVPVVADAGDDNISICQGQSGVQIGTAPVAADAVSYNWSIVSGTQGSLSCTSCAQPIATPTAQSVYRLTVTVTRKGGATCSTTDNVTVRPVQAPGGNLAFAGSDKTLCKNETTVLGGTPDANYDYTWTSGQYLNASQIANPTFSAGTAAVDGGAITYLVTAVRDGCAFNDEVKVSVINYRITDQDETKCGPLWVRHLDEQNAPGTQYAWSVVSGNGVVLQTANGGQNAYLKSNAGTTTFRRTVTLNGVSCTADVKVIPCTVGGQSCDFDIVTLSEQGCPKVFGDAALYLGTTLPEDDYNFSWSPANLVDNATAPRVTITSTAQATITVTVTNKYDPTITCSEDIVINPPGWALPVFNSGDVHACANVATQLGSAPNAGFTYSWAPENGLNNPNISNPVATLASSQTYSVTIKETASGCHNVLPVRVSIDTPTANAGFDRAVCNGATVTLGTPVPEGTNWSYSWSPVNTSWTNGTNATTPQPQLEFAFTTPQTYTLTVTDPTSGCTAADEIVLRNTVSAGEYAGEAKTTCPGVEVELGREAEYQAVYAWSPAAGLSCTDCANPVAKPNTTTTYTVLVSYPGCTAPLSDQVTVTVNTVPNLELQDKFVCPAGPVAIGYGAAGNPAAPAGATYRWSPSTGLSSATAANPTATVTEATTYSVTVTLANGCTFQGEVLVTPTANAGADATICRGEATVIGTPAIQGATYAWTGSGIQGAANVAQPTVRPTVTTTYTVRVTVNGCATTDQVIVTVSQPATFNIAGNTAICEGGTALLGITTTPQPNTLWQWSPVAGVADPKSPTTSVSATATGTYRLTQTNLVTGCSNFKEVVIAVKPNNIQAETLTGPLSICERDVVNMPLTVTSTGSYQFSWSPSTGLSNAFIANPTLTTSIGRTYTVTITDNESQCQLVKTVEVHVRTAVECALPVILADFRVEAAEAGALISWATTGESNSERFDVERSQDGGQRWISIGSRPAKGESAGMARYSLADHSPERGLNYYRLKMVDADGSFAYSVIRSLRIERNGEATIIFPVPAYTTLQISVADWQDVSGVELLNTSGTAVYRSGKVPAAEIDVARLPGGVYVLRLIRKDGSLSQHKVVVAK